MQFQFNSETRIESKINRIKWTIMTFQGWPVNRIFGINYSGLPINNILFQFYIISCNRIAQFLYPVFKQSVLNKILLPYLRHFKLQNLHLCSPFNTSEFVSFETFLFSRRYIRVTSRADSNSCYKKEKYQRSYLNKTSEVQETL